jgi:hypothetical protein
MKTVALATARGVWKVSVDNLNHRRTLQITRRRNSDIFLRGNFRINLALEWRWLRYENGFSHSNSLSCSVFISPLSISKHVIFSNRNLNAATPHITTKSSKINITQHLVPTMTQRGVRHNKIRRII